MKPEQIKTIRYSLGMSQQAFAATLGVSFATVNRWENGRAKPQKDRIARIKALEDKMTLGKQYLGDGLYVNFDGYHIVLTAESGGQTNVVYLEPVVLEAFETYITGLKTLIEKQGGKL